MTFGGAIFINSNTVEFGGSGAGNHTVTGVLQGTNGKLTKLGTNRLDINATSATYTGTTTITAGELRLNPSANATFASPIVLNGGALGTTGITSTRTWTSSSTLGLTANSTIALASATAHTLTFAASNAVGLEHTTELPMEQQGKFSLVTLHQV
jgi:autotransporter-associated beta strand protein